MALTERQESSFTDVIDLYRGALQSGVAASGFKKGRGKPALEEAGVRALFLSSPANANTTAVGRSNADITMTLDAVKVEASRTIKDGWFFQLKTPGHPDFDQWWAIEGDGRTTPSRGEREANETVAFCHRTTDPTA